MANEERLAYIDISKLEFRNSIFVKSRAQSQMSSNTKKENDDLMSSNSHKTLDKLEDNE